MTTRAILSYVAAKLLLHYNLLYNMIQPDINK